MNLKQKMDEKVRKMDWFDIGLIKWSCVAFGILLVIWFPGLLLIDARFWIIVVIVLAIRPLYRVYMKK